MLGRRAAALCLTPLAAVVRAVAGRRRRLARSDVRLPVRVVSVGNLVVGGVGKTPIVARLAGSLQKRGYSVGVVTGAYGARPARREAADGHRFRCDIVTSADMPHDAATRVGDETVMLAEALPNVPIAAGRPKARAAEWLAANADLDIIVVDDGFQHHALARDIDIVLLDARRPFGDGRVLPAGRLREGPEALRDADIVVLTGHGEATDIAAARERVGTFAPQALVLTGKHVAVRARREPAGEPLDLEELAGARVLGVCGVGSPRSFERTLRELGADAEMMRYRDHHAYTDGDFRRVDARAEGRLVVTTAKDATKWRGRVGLPYVVIDVEMRLSDPKTLVDRILAAPPGQGGADVPT
ncbi:tetraacyldisaccharide 4'-kinase [Candidatus Poribacteria bacterium]|nr:tetraacyldisaccharide 4'-kinase [Candidatus Poribacteria bacterium]